MATTAPEPEQDQDSTKPPISTAHASHSKEHRRPLSTPTCLATKNCNIHVYTNRLCNPYREKMILGSKTRTGKVTRNP